MTLPDRETIHKLLKGELPPEDAVAVFRQLEDERTFDYFRASFADDRTFLDLLRNASVFLTQVPNPELDRLIRRFQASGSPTSPHATVAGSGQSPDNPTGTVFRPHTIGGFQILGLLGEGGMGAVFLAIDPDLKRRVAIKIMRPEVAVVQESRERFMLEAQAAARIEHDNVVDIYRVGIDGGTPFIAMPVLIGESLYDRLHREPISSVPMLLKVGREVALGLEAAHDKKLIHRDIKPANLWLESKPNADDPAAEFWRTKILDFGMARWLEGGVHKTPSGVLLGTPLFMPPEQGLGKPADARSDLFSLGVVLYRMATGEQPFKGETVMEVLTALATHEPPAPNALDPTLPKDVSALIVRLMHKNPNERYQSAREVVSEIDRIGRSMGAEAGPGVPAELPTAEFVTSPKSPAILRLGLFALALVVGSVVLAVTFSDSGGSPTRTQSSSKVTETVPVPVPAPPKTPTAGEERSFEIVAGVKMKFCWIPAGRAQLGSPKEEQDYLAKTYLKNERPSWLDSESETVRGIYECGGFWMAKYPVTQSEWKAVMGTSPSQFTGDRLPVEQVSWYDCVEFCNKVSANSKLPPRYAMSIDRRNFKGLVAQATVEAIAGNRGIRLPLEDEWEYACRGGSGNERAFYWGDSLDGDLANCNGNYPFGTQKMRPDRYREKTSEVGAYEEKAKHPWGLCDMSGNVRQWCESLYDDKGTGRVFRGGGWRDHARECRSAYRDKYTPDLRYSTLGFRLAIPAE